MSDYLYKRPDSKYWWVKVPILDLHGNLLDTHRASTKCIVKRDAKAVAQKITQDLRKKHQLGHRDNGALQEVAERYNAEIAARNPRLAQSNTAFIRRMCSNSRLTINISQLNRPLLADLKSRLIDLGHSPKSINNEITFWITVYNKASDDWHMDVDRTANWKNFKLDVKEKTRYLLSGEEPRYLQEIDPTRSIRCQPAYGERREDIQRALQDQHDLSILLIDTGARYSENAEVPWSDIDHINWKTINFYREKVGNEGTVHMTNRVREMLQRRWAHNGNSPYVFSSRDNPMEPRNYATKGIGKAIKRAGLNADHLVKRYGKFTPHCFRHTFASRLVQGGMSLYAVSRLLGHTDVKMTQRYAHLAPDATAAQAMAILNERNDV